MKITWMSVVLSLVAGFTVACGEHEHDEHDHDEHGLEEEACLHMENGPFTALQAGEDAASATDTEEGDWEHKRVDLSLVEDSEGSFVGFIKLEIASEGDYAFFINQDATLEVDGIAPELSEAEAECDGISHKKVFELEVGEHTLKVVGISAELQLVIEMVGEGGHDDH